MVGVAATNEKLRARAVRLVSEITGRKDGIMEALQASGFDVRCASLMLLLGVDAACARERLARAGGSLRRALA
jgi:N-acetylmuramic acid 6-phosphate etherase